MIDRHGARDPGQCLTVVLSGQVDDANAVELAATLTHATQGVAGTLVVDLAGVTSFGPAGVRCLLEVNAWARSAGVQFLVARPSVVVERSLEDEGAGRDLDLVPSSAACR